MEGRPLRGLLQGYLTHKKLPHPETLQLEHAEGPVVVLGRGAVSYERGTLVAQSRDEKRTPMQRKKESVRKRETEKEKEMHTLSVSAYLNSTTWWKLTGLYRISSMST